MRLYLLAFLLSELAPAQIPRIGVVDFYGLHKVPEARLRKALGAGEGDPLPRSKGDTEERLDKLPGVVESHLEAVCCDGNKTILYVGIEERGAPHFELRDAPVGEQRLSDDAIRGYNEVVDALGIAARRGLTDEDLTQGHRLSNAPEAREKQEDLIPIANLEAANFRDVLRNSGDEDQRAMAAYIIAYATDQKDVVGDLEYALRDSDPGVRANAVRALVAMAVKERLDPKAQLSVSPTWFIEMLNSLSWSDRNRALGALQILTDNRDRATLQQLRERALPALVEMARWKTLEHALPAYMLVGRIAGLPDDQLKKDWDDNNREAVIRAAVQSKKK